MTSVLLNENERWVISQLRAIKGEHDGKGHGTLRVDIVDGCEQIAKREHSERAPLRSLKINR